MGTGPAGTGRFDVFNPPPPRLSIGEHRCDIPSSTTYRLEDHGFALSDDSESLPGHAGWRQNTIVRYGGRSFPVTAGIRVAVIGSDVPVTVKSEMGYLPATTGNAFTTFYHICQNVALAAPFITRSVYFGSVVSCPAVRQTWHDGRSTSGTLPARGDGPSWHVWLLPETGG
ncbi:uncharacterized protein LY79DRAFT_665355 [Colletotrichum navitas]|uniref:Uncharacterized protein n=1 Tax=Colletotrichum navitas TaxID=681940 RepID=A0AAD8VC44_9PEZI|nr:uncharacterized protein LY79DRAFT_665355 [Colletotrichum navitas]KAK1599733.1 hypothetical protein LY79DRAFT_665355 [Colletotrichum navitas]